MPIIKGNYAPINVTGGVDINNKIKIVPKPAEPEPAENGVIKLTEADEQKLHSVFMGEDFGGDDFASWEEETEPEPERVKPRPVPETKKDSKETDEAIKRLAEQIIYDAREQAKIIIAEARQQADAVRNETCAEQAAIEADCRRKIDEAEKHVADIRLEAKDQGYARGREEGLKKGSEEGYIQGLKKCHETLLELKKLNEDIVAERNSLIQSYERQVFELVFAISQKITVDSLKQKDKKKLPGDLNIAFEILDARYRSGKATVISSEWLIDDIFKMDAGLAGRIKQSAYLVQINYAENRDWRART